MKKIYISPVLTKVTINVEHHLMDLSSYTNTASISSRTSDVDGFVKDNSSTPSYNVWDDDWSR